MQHQHILFQEIGLGVQSLGMPQQEAKHTIVALQRLLQIIELPPASDKRQVLLNFQESKLIRRSYFFGVIVCRLGAEDQPATITEPVY